MRSEKQNRQEPSLVRIRGAKTLKHAFQARADLEAKYILSRRRMDRTACLLNLFKVGIGWKNGRRGTLARKASFRIQNRKGHLTTLKLNHVLQRKFKDSLKAFLSSRNRKKLRKQGEHYPSSKGEVETKGIVD